MKDQALVCGFTHPDGGSRLMAVTRHRTEEGWFVIMHKIVGGEPDVMVYGTIGACDSEFMSLVEEWTLDGYEFNGEIEASILPLSALTKAKAWADDVLDFGTVLLKEDA